jgi:eukaryotic-like serine/threonine-protein kinase
VLIGTYRFGEFTLRTRSRSLERHGATIPLPSKTFEVLLYLVTNPGRLISKAELMKAVWPDAFVEEGNLTQHVFRLRKILQSQGDAPMIVTVPGQGYQFTAVVEAAAEFVPAEPPPPVEIQKPPRGLRRWKVAVAGASALALAALGLFGGGRLLQANRAGPVPIVVPPFENRTGDSSFDVTLTSALSIDMAQSPRFRVLARTEFHKTLALMKRPADTRLTEELAREICQRSNSRVLVEGAIGRLGNLYSLTLEATECSTGRTLASERAEPASKEDALKSLDRLTADLRGRLGESAASVRQFSVPLLKVETASFDAVRDYSEAIDLYDRGRMDESVARLQHAIALDPNFALAYAALATAYDNRRERGLAIANASKAYALRETVGDHNRFPLMIAYDEIATGDLNEVIRTAQIWAETFPQDVVPWNSLANTQEELGEFPQALASARKAAELAPSNGSVLTTLARAFYHVGRFREAGEVSREAIARGVDSPAIHGTLVRLAFLEQNQEGIHQQLEWSRTGLPERALLMQSAAFALRQGKLREARESIDRAVEQGNKGGLGGFQSLYALDAFVLTQVGLDDEARGLLGQKEVATDLANGLVASALAGDPAAPEATVTEMVKNRPADTLLHYVYAPQVRAAAALSRGNPREAIDLLRPSLEYAMRDFHIPSLLGGAYLAARMPADAEREYRRILDNPGIDPLSLQYPLAQLGLARALALEGKRMESAREYQRFFADWKSADADLPVMQAARREYAALELGH